MRPLKKVYFLLCLFLVACKDPIPAPEATLLQLPEADQSCLYVSVNAATARVSFSWGEALHTDTYTLEVVNLVSQEQVSVRTEQTVASLTLDRGAPYRWQVISSSNASNEEVASESRRFYLEGLQQVSHVPFPAKLLSPQMNEIIELTDGEALLSWSGLDLDNDITSYSVAIGISVEGLNEVAANIQLTNYTARLEANTSYVWQITTRDELDNTSISPYFYFQTTP